MYSKRSILTVRRSGPEIVENGRKTFVEANICYGHFDNEANLPEGWQFKQTFPELYQGRPFKETLPRAAPSWLLNKPSNLPKGYKVLVFYGL